MIRTLCVLYLHINCLWICILVEFVFVFIFEFVFVFVFVFAFVFVLIFVLFDFGRSFGHVITKWFPQCVIEGGPASNAPLRKTEWEIMNDNHQTIGSDKCSISLNWPKTPRVEAQIVTDGFSRELVMEEMLIMSRMEVYTNKPPGKVRIWFRFEKLVLSTKFFKLPMAALRLRKFLFLWSGTHCVCGLWVGRIYMPSIMLYLRIPATVCSDLRATLWFQRHPFFCETKGMGNELAEMLTLKSASDFQSFLGKSKILKRAPGKWQPPQLSNLNSGVYKRVESHVCLSNQPSVPDQQE